MNALWNRRRDEQGMTIILSVMVCFVVFAIGSVWIGISMHQLNGSGREKLRETARNAAEAGLHAAMSRLSADPFWAGETAQQLPGAEFEVSVIATSPNPDDPIRYIVAKGYAPSKTSPQRAAKRLEQQIQLIPTNSFRYALFSSPGGVSGANRMTVNGDVYSTNDLSLTNHATVAGSVTSLGSVTTANNSTIGGDVHAGGDATLHSSSTTVLGNVYAGGNVAMTGHVKGNVQAGGTISGGTVDGSRAEFSPPAPPASQTLPDFTWDPANYPSGSVSEWATPAAFNTYWSANTGGFSGAHRIACPAPCTTTISLGSKWTLSGDTTIVADGPISLTREISNAAGHPVTLTIVSLFTDTATTPAISMSNNVTLPDDIQVVFYANQGSVGFRQLKHFTGTVYASSITLDQQFTLTFEPVEVPGFDFGVTSSSHFAIQAGAFKEVPFS
ncbi:MAG: hypothetical protein ACRDJP_03415 [Actinomycetota bacterium]